MRKYTILTLALATATMSACGSSETKSNLSEVEIREFRGDDMLTMIVKPDIDPTLLPELARNACGDRSFCKIFVWDDASKAPRGFPMTDRELEAQVFGYGVNRDSGYEDESWNCDRWEDLRIGNCRK